MTKWKILSISEPARRKAGSRLLIHCYGGEESVPRSCATVAAGLCPTGRLLCDGHCPPWQWSDGHASRLEVYGWLGGLFVCLWTDQHIALELTKQGTIALCQGFIYVEPELLRPGTERQDVSTLHTYHVLLLPK